jgi:hypothetical protein
MYLDRERLSFLEMRERLARERRERYIGLPREEREIG